MRATRRYGLLLDHIEWAFVQGWAYLCPRPVEPLGGWHRRNREAWDDLVRASPTLRHRMATSATVFERKPWREDLAAWDRRVNPTITEANRRLGQVDVARLGHDELPAHLDRCRAHLLRALYVHHRLNVTSAVPVGDLLVHAQEWTGIGAGELLQLLQGAGPRSTASAGELDRLTQELTRDPDAHAALSARDDGTAVLARLRSLPGSAGDAVTSYVELVGWWSGGTSADVADPCLMEMPDVLVESVRAAVTGGVDSVPAANGGDAAGTVRSAVPGAHRAMFDGLLADARAVHRLRDERALSCDVWARGLMRRAMLAAGTRLADAGALQHPLHVIDAGHDEIRSLLDRSAGPAAAELAERARRRHEASADDAPDVLGGPPPSPVPTTWLTAGPARTERAFRAYVAAMSEGDDDVAAGSGVRGTPASPGVHEGRALLVHSASDLPRLREGDVLVTQSTSPAFNPVLPLAGAVVTDHGGQLSHAAIVARELGIPAVVGTGDATRRIADGARVRVDGNTGEVTVLA